MLASELEVIIYYFGIGSRVLAHTLRFYFTSILRFIFSLDPSHFSFQSPILFFIMDISSFSSFVL